MKWFGQFEWRVGTFPMPARCRAKHGDVGGPWVCVKHWRCEPAFFGYFLCGGKESDCRPAQGQRPRREAHRGCQRKEKPIASQTIKKTKSSTTGNRLL